MQPDDYNNLKDWLLPRIQDSGMTVEEFANSVGLSRASLYHYMNDTCRPNTETMARICEALGESLAEGLAQYSQRPLGRPAAKRRV
jgi:transcriptional regulator with XRE-family HTH domain